MCYAFFIFFSIALFHNLLKSCWHSCKYRREILCSLTFSIKVPSKHFCTSDMIKTRCKWHHERNVNVSTALSSQIILSISSFFMTVCKCVHTWCMWVYVCVHIRERKFKVLSSNMIESEDGAHAILRLFFLCSFFFHIYVKILLQDMLEMFVNKS